jgi:hypothetical protein
MLKARIQIDVLISNDSQNTNTIIGLVFLQIVNQ